MSAHDILVVRASLPRLLVYNSCMSVIQAEKEEGLRALWPEEWDSTSSVSKNGASLPAAVLLPYAFLTPGWSGWEYLSQGG